LPLICGLCRADSRIPRIGDAFHDLGRVDAVTSDLTMLRPSVLKILILGLLSPGAALALGLGDIQVKSALNQPLSAQIEIVGGTAENSAGLTATIADAETFQRHGMERPASLASTALTVRQDGQGHTVLFLRSTDAFTEPMVTLLVDLHSTSGELIREYTVMLDPPGLTQEHAAVESASAPAEQLPATGSVGTPTSVLAWTSVPAVAAASASTSALAAAAAPASTPAPAVAAARASTSTPAVTAAPASTPATHTYTVARRDTLDRIAGIAGARTRSARRTMMIAIFRANPNAFRTNLNSLRSGVTLHLPSVAELSKIPADEANREFATQMAAWRSADHHLASAATASAATASSARGSARAISAGTSSAGAGSTGAISAAANSTAPTSSAASKSASLPPTTVAPVAASAGAIAEEKADIEAHEAETVALTQRIASLEKSLDEVQQKLRHPPVAQRPPVEQPAVGSIPVPVAATEQYADDEPTPAPRHGNWLVTLAVRVGLVLGAGIALSLALIGGIWLYRRRRDADSFDEADFAREEPVRREPDNFRSAKPDETSLTFPKIDISASYLVEEMKHAAEHATDAAGATEATVAMEALPSPEPSDTVALPQAATDARGSDLATHDPTVKLAVEPTVKMRTPRGNYAETTAVLALHPDLTLDDTAAREFAFFNPESSLNTTHVLIAGDSGDAKPFVERRKNPADVLRQAIEREPERSDLRLKLLELYYTAAAQNRRAFVEAVRQLARNDKLVASPSDWTQIEDMGRAIAPDDELFSNGSSDSKKAVA
jgi:pilus assembly protein FimV